jgi:cobalt-zinc-cadmium efflux system outer membrane protein
MKTIMGGAIVLAALHSGPGAPVAGQETPLAALLAEADRANPTIAGARSLAEAAAARVPQAGALPDPMLGLALMNVPLANPGFGNDEMTMAQLRVEASLPWPGKLGLAEGAARLEAEAAVWEVEGARWSVRTRVERVYYEIYFLDRAIEVASATESLLADLALLSTVRYGVGSASQADALEAQTERTRVLDQLAALEQERERASARLNELLARSTGTTVTTVTLPERVRAAALGGAPEDLRFTATALGDVLPDVLAGGAAGSDGGIPPVAELRRMALVTNPALQAHTRRVEAQRSAVSLAGRSSLPDFSVSAAYSTRRGLGDFFDLMVSASVPIFSGRKQSQAVVEQRAMLAEHEARHHALIHELESETASYRVGRVDFPMVLDAQAALYRHELEYHRLLADFAVKLAELEQAVGAEVLP